MPIFYIMINNNVQIKNMKNSLKNYEIHQKLGSGSYGVIYKAISKADRSVCVLKQINLARMSERAKKNAINQATIMGKLKHPFIVCYIESFIEDRTLNILMEYCDGGDLSYFLKQQNKKFLKQQKIWRFFIEICMGLQHIHKNKILHRDIKSLNIFLNKNGTVKIGDLGVAKMLTHNDFAQTMVGTPYYLSPQLCEQKPYNQKSDIWALGCLLYELCTFKHPFEAANQASLILKIIRGKFSPVPQFYSKDLKDMIDWCLQRDYKRRPTANVILSKPIVKKYIEEYKIDKSIVDFNADMQKKQNQKNSNPIKKQQPPNKSSKKLQPPPINVKSTQKIKQPKVLDDIVKKTQPISERRQPPKKSQPIHDAYPPSREMPRRRSQRKINNEDDKPKMLFGNVMPQSKEQFISNLQAKIQKSKAPPLPKPQKREPVYFEIPARQVTHSNAKEKLNRIVNQIQPSKDKIVVHNKQLLEQDSHKKKVENEQVQKVKMQKKIVPKVYEQVKMMDKPKPIIKSGGFSRVQQSKELEKKASDLSKQRKKSQHDLKSKQQKKSTEQCKQTDKNNPINLKDQRRVSYSMRNVRKQPEQKPSYLNKKRDSNGGVPVHYPPRVKKSPIAVSNQKIKAPVPQRKTTSTSRYHEVTKQQEQLVANLPDIIRKSSSSSQEDDKKISKASLSKKFKLNQIDNEMIAKKYQQIVQTQRTIGESNCQQNDEQYNIEQAPTKKVISSEDDDQQNIQQEVNIERSSAEVQEQLNGEDEINEQQQLQSQNIFEINRFQMNDAQTYAQEQGQNNESEWSFDGDPELPMLQQSQTPYFQEANPYLVQQKQKTEEEELDDKKKYLQMKLKQNMKREDQINQLMQMKIQQCRSVVPKGFQEILQFFRSKINMDREYTDEDEREVQAFLSSRNLTNQHKFQNIYKIMHFEMELDNTRRIIQTICKKLNELDVN